MDKLTQLLQFLEETPHDPFLQYCLALEYDKKDEPEKSLEYFQKLLNNDPNYVATYYHLGKLYEKMDRRDDAIITYTKGLEIAKQLNDNHTYGELLNARNELVNDSE